MSLYQVQKLMYSLNRDPRLRKRFDENHEEVIAEYKLTAQEREALLKPDIGLLYVLGVNGQILMHYAAIYGMAWPDYLEVMKEGLRIHGPVREGLYAMSNKANERIEN